MVTTLPKATDVVEPMAPAHRGYVRDTAKQQIEPVQQATDVLLYWRLQDQLNRAKQEIGSWNVSLSKEKDPQSRTLIEAQIDRAKDEQRRLDERLAKIKIPDNLK